MKLDDFNGPYSERIDDAESLLNGMTDHLDSRAKEHVNVLLKCGELYDKLFDFAYELNGELELAKERIQELEEQVKQFESEVPA